jgi:hypothetical protein
VIAEIIYLLCALTSFLCTVLLLRHYAKTKLPLLLWSGLAFMLFTATNVLLFIDLVMVPEINLIILRNGLTLSGVVLLLYGLISTKD